MTAPFPLPSSARELADALERVVRDAVHTATTHTGGNDPDTPLLHSIDDAAHLLGDISRDLVDRLIRDGDLDAVKISRLTRITHTSLTAYVDRLTRQQQRGAA